MDVSHYSYRANDTLKIHENDGILEIISNLQSASSMWDSWFTGRYGTGNTIYSLTIQ